MRSLYVSVGRVGIKVLCMVSWLKGLNYADGSGFAWFCLVDLVDLVVLHGNLLLVTCARSRTIPNEDISCTAWHLLAARD